MRRKTSTDIAIEHSANGRSHEWKSTVLTTICAIALRQPTLIVDDIRRELGEAFMGENPHSLGPVVIQAAKDGAITRTKDYVESTRESQHRRPVRVWRSLLYQAAA